MTGFGYTILTENIKTRYTIFGLESMDFFPHYKAIETTNNFNSNESDHINPNQVSKKFYGKNFDREGKDKILIKNNSKKSSRIFLEVGKYNKDITKKLK